LTQTKKQSLKQGIYRCLENSFLFFKSIFKKL